MEGVSVRATTPIPSLTWLEDGAGLVFPGNYKQLPQHAPDASAIWYPLAGTLQPSPDPTSHASFTASALFTAGAEGSHEAALALSDLNSKR